MKIKIKTSELKPILKAINKLSGDKSTYLWDRIIEIEADKGEYIKLRTMESPIVAFVSCKALAIEEPGKATVDKARFAQGIAPLKAGDELEMTSTDKELCVSFGNGSFTIPIVPCDTPFIESNSPQDGNVSTLSFKKGIVGNALATASLFVAKNGIRPSLGGIYLSNRGNTVDIASTDAHSLCWIEVRNDNGDTPTKSTIIPPKACELAAALEALDYGEGDDTTNVSFNESKITAYSHYFRLFSSCVDAKYPNYKAVVPTETPVRITVNKEEILSAVKRIEKFANKQYGTARLLSDNGTLRLSAADSGLGIKAAATVQEADAEGELPETGLNATRLRTMLEAMQCNGVTIFSSGSNDKGVRFEPDVHPDGVAFKGLIMPMMIQED